jgi:nitrate/TMAO reductase-like tetraheme cytochrome c subunit
VALGVVALASPVTWVGVEATSTPAFCDNCHEIAPAVESWRQSEHREVEGEVRAGCRDCHVPPWSSPVEAVWVKAQHGIEDVAAHLVGDDLGSDVFYFRTKEVALAAVGDDICLRCHAPIRGEQDIIETEQGIISGLHASAEARKMRCVVCHKNTGHGPFR